RRPQGERRHVEQRPGAAIVRSEREKTVAVRAERAPDAREVLFHQMERKRIVSRGHRRVRREYSRPTYLFQRFIEGRSALRQIANPLQDDERRVALVEMKDGGIRSERLERPHATDAEDDLLLNARLAIAAVQPRREFAIPRSV